MTINMNDALPGDKLETRGGLSVVVIKTDADRFRGYPIRVDMGTFYIDVDMQGHPGTHSKYDMIRNLSLEKRQAMKKPFDPWDGVVRLPDSAPVDPYAELKAAFARGETIQVRAGLTAGHTWMSTNSPLFCDGAEYYRIKPPDPALIDPDTIKWPGALAHCSSARNQLYCEGYNSAVRDCMSAVEKAVKP